MGTKVARMLVLLLVLGVGTVDTMGQHVLVGKVRSGDGLPLAGVEVLSEGDKTGTLSDSAGMFVLGTLRPGVHTILFRMLGFRPVRLSAQLGAQDTLRYDVTMERQAAQSLEPLEVEVHARKPRGIGREAFEERRRLGFGKFVDSTELRRSEHLRLSDVLRRIQGVRVIRHSECSPDASGRVKCLPPVDRAASGRGDRSIDRRGRDDYCWMSILLDGYGYYVSGGSQLPPDLNVAIRVNEIESIEVYRSAAEAPTEFGGSAAACGVILLWSRRGR